MFTLNAPSEIDYKNTKEAPMAKCKYMLSSTLETTWALVISSMAGLLPLS